MSDTSNRNNNSKKRLHPPSNNSSEGGKKSDTRRKNHKLRGNKNDEGVSEYADLEFHPRPSTGRPGSPHRYFNESFDVSFLKDSECVKRDDILESMNKSRIATSSLTRASTPPPSMTSSKKILPGINHQVVHRHLNGLCIITAGNVLENHKNQDDSIDIKSVKYDVTVGRDSKSAKGKIRARKHKKTKNAQGRQEAGGDGIVSPQSSLCIVTLSNGLEIELKCCVAGTVIELNKRVGSVYDNDKECENESDSGGNGVNAEKNVSVPNEENLDGMDSMIDTSLLMRDPLLDGYLAVILPRGVFPPSKSDRFSESAK